jgi:phosphoribosylamine---glycine ligase
VKFLVMSEGGDGHGLAVRLKQEGHDVKLWIREGAQDKIGSGLVDSANSYVYGQTVIADCTGFGSLLDKMRDQEATTFGGSSFADKLESDRAFAEEVMHRSDIDTPASVSAESWDDAAKAVERLATRSEKIVLKPEGSLSGVVPSYVAASEEEALLMLERMQKRHEGGKVELTIQEFVEGQDISTEGWFNGESWIEGMFNHTLEKKQLMNDDLGPSGGCTGNIVWPCDSKDPIVKHLLLNLTDVLQEHRYVGAIDVNCVVNDKGIYALEFTPRFGYDAFPTFLHTLFRDNFGSFVEDCARGADVRVELPSGFGAGVRLTIPPWPSSGQTKQVSIRGLEGNEDSFYPYGVFLDGEELKSIGEDGSLGVISAFGGSISEAFARCYAIIAKLEVPNLQYRTDLAHTFLHGYREVQRIFEGELNGWIATDLDGTLARYSGWSDEIGEPIPTMVQRVRRWISEGKEVRILTARGTIDGKEINKHEQLIKIHDWVNEHIGTPLFVTDRKDPEMIKLYDDRVRQVEEGTGELVNGH